MNREIVLYVQTIQAVSSASGVLEMEPTLPEVDNKSNASNEQPLRRSTRVVNEASSCVIDGLRRIDGSSRLDM